MGTNSIKNKGEKEKRVGTKSIKDKGEKEKRVGTNSIKNRDKKEKRVWEPTALKTGVRKRKECGDHLHKRNRGEK